MTKYFVTYPKHRRGFVSLGEAAGSDLADIATDDHTHDGGGGGGGGGECVGVTFIVESPGITKIATGLASDLLTVDLTTIGIPAGTIEDGDSIELDFELPTNSQSARFRLTFGAATLIADQSFLTGYTYTHIELSATFRYSGGLLYGFQSFRPYAGFSILTTTQVSFAFDPSIDNTFTLLHRWISQPVAGKYISVLQQRLTVWKG